MGIMSLPAGPGKIKIGAGMVGSSLGIQWNPHMEFGLAQWKLEEGSDSVAYSGKTADSVNLGRVGWMDGQIVLGINL